MTRRLYVDHHAYRITPPTAAAGHMHSALANRNHAAVELDNRGHLRDFLGYCPGWGFRLELWLADGSRLDFSTDRPPHAHGSDAIELLASARDLPPPLEYRSPDCSICGQETHWDDGFCCESCGCHWPERIGEDHGEWDDPDSQQCEFVARPFDGELAHLVYRCLAADGHQGDHLHSDVYSQRHWCAPAEAVAS